MLFNPPARMARRGGGFASDRLAPSACRVLYLEQSHRLLLAKWAWRMEPARRFSLRTPLFVFDCFFFRHVFCCAAFVSPSFHAPSAARLAGSGFFGGRARFFVGSGFGGGGFARFTVCLFFGGFDFLRGAFFGGLSGSGVLGGFFACRPGGFFGSFSGGLFPFLSRGFCLPRGFGTAGGFFATFLNGTKRGLFSNEAGQGSSPNGAATADVAHPVTQGLIQALGVFIDTIVICTATGLTVLLASPQVYTPGVEPEWAETTLVQHALADALPGGWVVGFMTFVVFTFAYSSVLGYSAFAEINVSYLGGGRTSSVILRLAMTAATGLGAVVALELAWVMADIALALMTILNLVAVLWLSRWVFATLGDYDGQRARGVAEPAFVASGNPLLPRELPGDVWTAERAAARVVSLDEA